MTTPNDHKSADGAREQALSQSLPRPNLDTSPHGGGRAGIGKARSAAPVSSPDRLEAGAATRVAAEAASWNPLGKIFSNRDEGTVAANGKSNPEARAADSRGDEREILSA